jgi:hypothetical protein
LVLRNGPEVRSCPDFIAAVANKFICCSGHANVVSTSCAAKIVVVANKFFDITVIKKDMRFLPSVIRRPSVRHGSLGSLTAGGTKVTAGELALQRLANVPRGIAKTLMLAHGFTYDLIAGLEQAGLVTVAPDIATIGGRTIEVELVMITDAGRRALDGLITQDRREHGREPDNWSLGPGKVSR